MDESPSTPSYNPPSPLKSTPQSLGVSGRVSEVLSSANLKASSLGPILLHDLHAHLTITPTEFLREAFPTPAPLNSIDAISTNPDTQALLTAYRDAVDKNGHERRLYHPFVKLVNHMFSKAREFLPQNSLEIVFIVNDPKFIVTPKGRRSPDVIVVRKQDETKRPIRWEDVISTFEFKCSDRQLAGMSIYLSPFRF